MIRLPGCDKMEYFCQYSHRGDGDPVFLKQPNHRLIDSLMMRCYAERGAAVAIDIVRILNELRAINWPLCFLIAVKNATRTQLIQLHSVAGLPKVLNIPESKSYPISLFKVGINQLLGIITSLSSLFAPLSISI